MKNFRVLLMVLTIGIVMASCSKDDDAAASVSGSKYETTYVKYTETYMGETESGEFDTKEELMAAEQYSVIEFKTDGSFYVDSDPNGTWVQSGSSITITDGTDVITGTVEGNKFKITINESNADETYIMIMEFTKM